MEYNVAQTVYIGIYPYLCRESGSSVQSHKEPFTNTESMCKSFITICMFSSSHFRKFYCGSEFTFSGYCVLWLLTFRPTALSAIAPYGTFYCVVPALLLTFNKYVIYTMYVHLHKKHVMPFYTEADKVTRTTHPPQVSPHRCPPPSSAPGGRPADKEGPGTCGLFRPRSPHPRPPGFPSRRHRPRRTTS